MQKLRVLLADGHPIRRARLVKEIESDPALELLAVTKTLMEAYNSVETLCPDAVAISAEMVALPEFGMLGALLKALGLYCVVYGETRPPNMRVRRPGAGHDFLRIDANFTPSTLTTALGRARSQGVGALAATTNPDAFPVVAIGASTGGIEALHTVLSDFPETCPPTVIVQHIRGDFTPGVVARLNSKCAANVREAEHNAMLKPGVIYLAPGNETHLTIKGTQSPSCRLVRGDPISGHRPSVDALFDSVAALAPRVIGVLLTGMGRDGAKGLFEIHRRGGLTIAQDEATSTVYGMPRVAVESGAVDLELPVSRIARAIIEACHRPATPNLRKVPS